MRYDINVITILFPSQSCELDVLIQVYRQVGTVLWLHIDGLEKRVFLLVVLVV